MRAGESSAEAAAPGRRPNPREPPGRTRPAGKPRPHLGRRPAIPTRCHAADPAPASPGKANCVRKPSARPTPVAPCSRVLMVSSHRGWRAPRDPPGSQGKSPCARSLPGQHWSPVDRLAPALGAASRDRHGDALRGHTQGPPRLWLRSRPRPCLGRPRSDSQRKPPPVTPGSHRCAGGCVGCTGRPILSEASQDRAARNSGEPGVLHRTARVEAMSSPLVSSRPYFAISLFFGPSFVNSSFQKTFSLRPPTPSCRLSRRCLAGKGCGSGFRGAGRAKGWR